MCDCKYVNANWINNLHFSRNKCVFSHKTRAKLMMMWFTPSHVHFSSLQHHLISKLILHLVLYCVHNAVSLSPMLSSVHLHHCILFSVFFLFHRSLTSNLPSVNLPNVNLQMPKVPNLSVNLRPMQMPSFSTPNWMPGLSDTECVLSRYWILIHACVALASTYHL